MVTAAISVWNDEMTIADTIRSIKAYADRFVVVDCAYLGNQGAPNSTDRTREIVEGLVGDRLTYITPPERLHQHEARDLYLEPIREGDWLFVLDADELLVGGRDAIARLFARPPSPVVSFNIFTTQLVAEGLAPDVSEETYSRAPIIQTRGIQPRLFQKRDGLRHRPTWEGVGWANDHESPLRGELVENIFVYNSNVAQPYSSWQTDFLWKTSHQRLRPA